MSEYRKVFIRIWGDEKFQALSDDAKILWFYIISCPHGHLSGLFVVDKLYILGDLRWTSRRLNRAFAEISAAEMIFYDEKARLIFIKNALRYDPITNENQAKHVIKHLASLPNSRLISEFCKTALLYTKDEKSLRFLQEHTKGFMEPLPKGLGKPLGKPLPNSEAVAVAVTETEALAVTPQPGTPPGDIAPAGAFEGAPRAMSTNGNSAENGEPLPPHLEEALRGIHPDTRRSILAIIDMARRGEVKVATARLAMEASGIQPDVIDATFREVPH